MSDREEVLEWLLAEARWYVEYQGADDIDLGDLPWMPFCKARFPHDGSDSIPHWIEHGECGHCGMSLDAIRETTP